MVFMEELIEGEEFRKVFLPYCLQREPDGSYVVCNRFYKPVGLTLRDHIDYASFPVRVKFGRMTAVEARRLAWNESSDLDRIYLYHDGSIPTDSAAHWRAYAERLSILAKYQVSSVK